MQNNVCFPQTNGVSNLGLCGILLSARHTNNTPSGKLKRMFELHIFQIFLLALFKGDIYVHLQCYIDSCILNATELSISCLVLGFIFAGNSFYFFNGSACFAFLKSINGEINHHFL